MNEAGWYDVDDVSLAQAERVVERAALQEGETVLDVGAGAGLLTFAARARIGDGWVIAVDPSVDALEELLRRAHEREAAGIMYLVGEAEVLPLPDASVDAAVLRSVLVHVDDLAAAAHELARVVRPGGRVSLREPLDRGTSLSTGIDWGELDDRVKAVWGAIDDPLQRLDEDAVRAAFDGWRLDVAVDDPGEAWTVTRESAHARLDARGTRGQPSLRDRWAEAFTPAEVDALVARLDGLEGETITFARPELYLTAHR